MPGWQRRRNAVQSQQRENTDSSKVRLKAVFAYDGTTFKGFQAQQRTSSKDQQHSETDDLPASSPLLTVQGYIETRLSKLLQRYVAIFPSGRTDKGVHATGAVCHFDICKQELQKLASYRGNDSALNMGNERAGCRFLRDYLSKPFPVKEGHSNVIFGDISVVGDTFDARFSAIRKVYTYTVFFDQTQEHENSRNLSSSTPFHPGVVSPFFSRYCWSLPEKEKIDLKKVEHVVSLLKGVHNFQWLVVVQDNEQRNFFRDLSVSVSPLTLSDSARLVTLQTQLTEPSSTAKSHSTGIPGFYQFTFTCDYFLYKMIRRLVGLILNVGLGKVETELVSTILAHFDAKTEADAKAASGKNITDELKRVVSHYCQEKVAGGEESFTLPMSALLSTAPAKALFLQQVIY